MSLPGEGKEYDVIIAGGGNAALCAALTAAEGSDRVLLLEKAPPTLRAGNTRHTRDIRYAHDADRYTSGPYSEEEFVADILRVTGGETNEKLAKMLVHKSTDVPDWMAKQGIIWKRMIRGALHLGRTNAFFLGGGKTLANTYYEMLQRKRVPVLYDSEVEEIIFDGDCATGVRVKTEGRLIDLESRAVIVASGGFEANTAWLRSIWGEAADNFAIRGTRLNDGKLLSKLLEKGAATAGNPKQGHMIAVDARAPRFDGGITTRVDSIPFGIVVNKLGKRFYDEGEDEWPKRYAIWGKLIAEQPGQVAYSVFDSTGRGRFIPAAFPPYQADSIEELERDMALEPQSLSRAVQEFNQHVPMDCAPDFKTLDGCKTEGLAPPKSHWAAPIRKPPFFAYALRPGLTFTYMGVGVDEKARVLMNNGRAFENLYAAGEIVAGNILGKGYLAGFGLTIGTVFGRIAGDSASK
jgi:tricarballylate dehydrogenase